MSSRIGEIPESIDLKKFENEIQDWIIQNVLIISEIYSDYPTSTTITEQYDEAQYAEFNAETTKLKTKLKSLIKKDNTENIPSILDRIIMKVFGLLNDPDLQDSKILIAIAEFCISVLTELKREDPGTYSSLEPYQQFSPNTFYSIGDEISKNNNLVEAIDGKYWKDIIFNDISDKEGNELLKHSLRSLILYCNTLQNRKIRLQNLR